MEQNAFYCSKGLQCNNPEIYTSNHRRGYEDHVATSNWLYIIRDAAKKDANFNFAKNYFFKFPLPSCYLTF